MKAKAVKNTPKTAVAAMAKEKSNKLKKMGPVKVIEEVKELKKGKKTQMKKMPPPKKVEIEEDEDSDEDESDSGADVMGEENGNDASENEDMGEEEEDNEEDDDDEDDDDENEGLVEDEAEIDENDEDDDDDEDEEDDDDDEDEEEVKKPEKKVKGNKKKEVQHSDDDGDDSDDDPTEAPIEKSEGIPKINTGPLTKNFPSEQIVTVRNLPKSCSLIEMVEVFGKFGELHTVNFNQGPLTKSAIVAFKTPDAVKAVLDTKAPFTIKKNVLKVFPKSLKVKKSQINEAIKDKEEYTVYVGNLKKLTGVKEVEEHFSKCGKISTCRIFKNTAYTYALVVFEDLESVEKAIKLHLTELKNSTIIVSKHGQKERIELCPERTIVLKNTQNLSSIAGDKLKKIFSDCGEIDTMKIMCSKFSLAFIQFKTKEAVQKAFKKNGKTINDLPLDICEFNSEKKVNTKIYITNVKPGVSEDELREVFNSCGDINSVSQRENSAIIEFQTVDGFCKSFTKHETRLGGQYIFIQPYSTKKNFAVAKLKQRQYNSPFKAQNFGKNNNQNRFQGDNKGKPAHFGKRKPAPGGGDGPNFNKKPKSA